MQKQVHSLSASLLRLLAGATSAEQVRIQNESAIIAQSRLFDDAFYLKQLDPSLAKVHPILHYSTEGFKCGFDPSPRFSSSGYMRAFGLNADVNPLWHHINRCLEMVKESEGFDEAYYLSKNPDLVGSGFEAAWHFLAYGWQEGRRPSRLCEPETLVAQVGWNDVWLPSVSPKPDSGGRGENLVEDRVLIEDSLTFDAAYYMAQNKDVATSGVDPLEHFLAYGGFEGRNPNNIFKSAWYLNQYREAALSGLNPLVHYLRIGIENDYNPSSDFDTKWYLETNKDVQNARVNPLGHYIHYGAAEGRLSKPPKDSVDLVGKKLQPYESWCDVNQLSAADIAELRAELDERKGKLPKISIVTAVYNTDPQLLTEMVDSVLGQVYENWELCLANDGSSAAHVVPLLEKIAKKDKRIKIVNLEHNGGISVASNAAAKLATGDVFAFVDHDDIITRNCTAELAIYYADHPEAEIVYSDDDKIDMEGKRYAPQFKPDWSPVLLLSFMYISHIFSVRKNVFKKLGGFRQPFDGSQDYDFALRASEIVEHVGHIPKVLYHWRAAPGSTAASADTKPASLEAGRKAVEEAIQRRGFKGAKAIHPQWADEARVGMFDLVFPDKGPSVSLIIPTKNQVSYLRTCIESLKMTTYQNYKILVIDNESDDPETLKYLSVISKRKNCKVVKIDNNGKKFSYAYVNNQAVKHADTDYVLFLNNDTKVVTPEWLSQMMGYVQMPGVGAVGARLYFEDGNIQHAGIVHGYHDGLVGHAFRNLPPYNWGYLGFVRTSREYSGVTAACMLTPKALFESLNGFDEVNFAVAYNDVDYSYRLVEAGKTCVYCSSAELFHFEGKSRGFTDDPQERVNFRRIYGRWKDRWYNPNLSLENEYFEPLGRRLPSKRTRPVRVVAVSHNLNNEGAPTTLMDLLIGLKAEGHIEVSVISPSDGPLRAIYEEAGIKIVIAERLMSDVVDLPTFKVARNGVGTLFLALDAEVVIANTLQTYWAVAGAEACGIPAIWCQHESEPWEIYFDYLPDAIRPLAYRAFTRAYQVTYVAEATRCAWRPLEVRGNFSLIRHGIPPGRLAQEVGRWTRAKARKKLGLTSGDLVVTVVGTVCQRKAQLDLVKAYAGLPEVLQSSIRIYLAGRVAESEYGEAIDNIIKTLPKALQSRVTVTGRVDDPFLYYRAADIYACTSIIESAPRVLVEAMACGLPIITTPAFGIPEIVREKVNALFYPAGDAEALGQALERMAADQALRKGMASKSQNVLNGQPGFNEMVDSYSRLIKEAVNLAVVP